MASLQDVLLIGDYVMPEFVYKLNGVPEDEANEIREVLADAEIDFYETSSGRWGISMAAIWLKTDDQLAQAKALISDYQQQRVTRVRAEYEEAKREGRVETLSQRFVRQPLPFLFLMFFVVLVLYFSLMPFIDL